MPLPPLQPLANCNFYISGDVTIHKEAAIAPGVILQADPDSRIIIAAGVCIGMGAILHAHQGTLEVDTGATLGAGVLVVGRGKIGTNACVGSVTTIWNSNIEPLQLIASGSLIGETGRKVAIQENVADLQVDQNIRENSTVEETQSNSELSNSTVLPSPWDILPPEAEKLPLAAAPILEPVSEPVSELVPEPVPEPDQPIPSAPLSSESAGIPVYGKVSLNRLLVTLFPHNQSLQLSNQAPETEE